MSEQQYEAAAARVLAAAENDKPDRAPKHALSDPFLRPRQISEATGLHYITIGNAIRRGDLKAQRLGKRALGVRSSEVARWLASLNGEEAA
jgi:predicted DNA-binding transcriptional regulator AlpA